MALFSNTPKTTRSGKTTKSTRPGKTASKQGAKVVKKLPEDGRLESILKAPWLSEKALIGTEKGVYVFAIPSHATKTEVLSAIELIYKVKPVKVNIVNLPAKKVSMRTRRGQGARSRRHKAYVYLKKGETIHFA